MKSSGSACEHFTVEVPGMKKDGEVQAVASMVHEAPAASVLHVRDSSVLLWAFAQGWISAWVRKTPASTSIIWPIAPPRQLLFVPS